MTKNTYSIKKDEQNKVRIFNNRTQTYIDIYYQTKQKAYEAMLYLERKQENA